jgi:sterol O-acyltransferase
VKVLAHFLALLGSSLIHEYVISIGVGYVIPVLTFFFAGIGSVVFIFWPNKNELIQRLSFAFSLSFGSGTIIWVNFIELQARKLCPREENFGNLFFPRFIECYEN